MSRNTVAGAVRRAKEDRPERYCPAQNCLWRTGGGYCPRHKAPVPVPTVTYGRDGRVIGEAELEAAYNAPGSVDPPAHATGR